MDMDARERTCGCQPLMNSQSGIHARGRLTIWERLACRSPRASARPDRYKRLPKASFVFRRSAASAPPIRISSTVGVPALSVGPA